MRALRVDGPLGLDQPRPSFELSHMTIVIFFEKDEIWCHFSAIKQTTCLPKLFVCRP